MEGRGSRWRRQRVGEQVAGLRLEQKGGKMQGSLMISWKILLGERMALQKVLDATWLGRERDFHPAHHLLKRKKLEVTVVATVLASGRHRCEKG